MMNNYQDDYNNQNKDLEYQIQQLKEENHYLKEEIRRLNASLTGLNSQNADIRERNLNSPLVDYYLTRYNEIHEYVLNNRIATIDEEIKKAEDAYALLTTREESLEEIANKNKSLQNQIVELKEAIEANKLKLKEANECFNKEAEVVTGLENNIYNTTMDYYNNLLAKLSIGDSTETREYINFIMDVLKYTLYDEVLKYLKKAKIALNDLDELNILEYEIKNENLIYSNEITSLESGIEVISFEETEKKLDSLAYEITNKKASKNELIKLFEDLLKRNTKQIKDEIKHLQILEYNNQQIALKMDEIVLEYRNTLSKADTNTNILLTKKLLLQKLKEEFANIEPLKVQYDKNNTQYIELQNMHQTITTNIDEIEDFVESAKNIMDANISFKQILREYDEIKIKKEALKMNLDTYLLREKSLIEARKQILNNPYGKTDLINLDGELKEVQDSISGFNAEIRQLDSSMYQLKETEQDYKLITIYDEAKACEKALPGLYDKQRILANLISDKYVEVSSLKMKCANYDDLQKQIEEITNEINRI